MFVKELEITLENGMKISGELDLPERQGQWKTIILFHGSGPSDRHATVESMGGIVSRNFDLLSEGFVKARYAVFRYDKRENYDIEIIIRDAREVTRFVSGLSEVEGILFYGWSEGVRVCTTLVSDFPNAQALILQSGIAEGWSSYFSYILRELTVEKLKELDNNSDSILEISDFLNCIPDSTSISFSLYLLILGTDKEGNMKFNEELDPEGKGRFSIIDNWIPLADEIVADPTTLIRFAENAPGETWAGILDDIKKIQLPILVLHGLNDGWISPVEAVQIAKAARNNADIILFKGLGHSLSKVSSPLKDEGGTIEDETNVYPLTDVQAAYLVGKTEAVKWGGIGCKGYIEVDFGSYSAEELSRAWKVLVNRHEMLRAKVTEVGFEILERDEIDYEIKIVNLQKMAEREKVDTLSKIREDFSEYVFHTEEPPLFKVLITKRIEGNYFHLLVDLIVSDFASVQLLISEMGELLKGASLEKIRNTLPIFRHNLWDLEMIGPNTAFRRSSKCNNLNILKQITDSPRK